MRIEQLIFLFLNQKHMLWVLKRTVSLRRSSHWDGSFEHPKYMLKLIGKKIFTIVRSKILFIQTISFVSQVPSSYHTLSFLESSECRYSLWNFLLDNSPVVDHSLCGNMLLCFKVSYEPQHEISNNVVCATSKGTDQPAHSRRLIRAFTRRLNIQWVLSYWLNIIWSF